MADLEATHVFLDGLSEDDALGAMRTLGQPVEALDRAAHDAGFHLEVRVTREEKTQTTPAGQVIPIPARGDFDEMVRKVAPPAGRKRPAETDEPREQSN